jgi:hypothetical protein
MSFENSIKDAVDSLRDGNPAEFSQYIKGVLLNKLSDRMDVEKVSIASQMFGEPASEDDSTETNDDENS